MICPHTFEPFNFKIMVNTREIMKDTAFFESLDNQNIDFRLGWNSWPPDMAVGPIWFKTEEDLNVAKLLL